MYELIPIVAGVVSGLVVSRLPSLRLKAIALAVCSAGFGALASFISGELSVSWAFLLIDTALVLLSASVTIAFVVGGSAAVKLNREQ
jgi:hypothetical protein